MFLKVDANCRSSRRRQRVFEMLAQGQFVAIYVRSVAQRAHVVVKSEHIPAVAYPD